MSDNAPAWYVLNYIAPGVTRNNTLKNIVGKFNASFATQLEVFAPTFIEMVQDGSNLRVVEKPLLYHYVFVKTDIDHLKKLCSLFDGFSLVLNRTGENRYLTLSEEEMNSFRIIAQFYGNKLPCYKTDCIELEEGDEVEVVDGEFAGLRGCYIPRKGSSKGNIIVNVSYTFASIAYDIKAEHIRILHFAKNSKRAYDQIDAIIPKLFTALRKHIHNERLSTAEISPLAVFCRRFEVTNLENSKMQAKLMAILMAANKILGNQEGYANAKRHYDKFASGITNKWTLGLIYLLQALTEGASDMLAKGYKLIEEETATESRFQKALRAEFNHYLSKCPE